MTSETEARGIVSRLRAHAVGSPATIAWPHRILHESAARIEELEARLRVLEIVAIEKGWLEIEGVLEAINVWLKNTKGG